MSHAKTAVLSLSVLALGLLPAAAQAHDCSGFDGTCGAQFHTQNTVTGGTRAGDVVTCTAGQAHASPGEPSYTGRFQRGSTPIPGTDFTGPTATYTLTDADVGFVIVCITEARHPKGDASSASNWHGPITAGAPAPSGRCAVERRGTAASETLNGTTGGDRLLGLSGNDVINGLQGDDRLFGDACDASQKVASAQSAAGGNDRITGAEGNDNLFGGAGKDKLSGGLGNDNLFGGAGNDSLSGADGNDVLLGAAGNDKLSGGAGNDTLQGGAGNDNVNAGQGKNTVFGGSGNDILNSVNGRKDTVDCGKGRDRLRADGNDKVRKGCERIIRAK